MRNIFCINLCDFCWLTSNIWNKQKKIEENWPLPHNSSPLLNFYLSLEEQLQLMSICVASKGQLEPRECSHFPTDTLSEPGGSWERLKHTQSTYFVKNRNLSPPPSHNGSTELKSKGAGKVCLSVCAGTAVASKGTLPSWHRFTKRKVCPLGASFYWLLGQLQKMWHIFVSSIIIIKCWS